MGNEIKVAIIGLDTSHSVEFPKLMQAPDCPAELKVSGLRAVSCMRFETPFQNKEGLDKRQSQLEAWGVKVTESFDEAVAGCDAIMIEINDPAYHLEYFKKAAGLGKPVFLDKPLAATVKEGRVIAKIAQKCKTRVGSCSSLRFGRTLLDALKENPNPAIVNVYGAMGKAPAGDSLVWYGVHVFEMLHRIMGSGAQQVTAHENASGVVAIVDYSEGRQAVVEARCEMWSYGGRLQSKGKVVPFVIDNKWGYFDLLCKIRSFFQGEAPPAALEDALEILAMMETARHSIIKRKAVALKK